MAPLPTGVKTAVASLAGRCHCSSPELTLPVARLLSGGASASLAGDAAAVRGGRIIALVRQKHCCGISAIAHVGPKI